MIAVEIFGQGGAVGLLILVILILGAIYLLKRV